MFWARWTGDSNFMTTVGETRVLPEELGVTWKRLSEAFATVRPGCTPVRPKNGVLVRDSEHNEAMRWILSVFRLNHYGPPSAREIPLWLAKKATFGAVTGPFWAAFFTSFSDPSAALRIFVDPVALFWAAVTGVVFASLLLYFMRMGNAWLRQIVAGYPPAIVRVVSVIYNAVAASLVRALSFAITHLPLSNIHVVVPLFWRIVAIDGVIGAVLALIIGAFIKLKLQVEESQTKVRELAVTASQAQARALQSQINPHFSFNIR